MPDLIERIRYFEDIFPAKVIQICTKDNSFSTMGIRGFGGILVAMIKTEQRLLTFSEILYMAITSRNITSFFFVPRYG